MTTRQNRTAALLANLPRHRAVPEGINLRSPPRLILERARDLKYIATHERTEPPPEQGSVTYPCRMDIPPKCSHTPFAPFSVVTTEKQHILLRQFQAREEQAKRERLKRAAAEPTEGDHERRQKGARRDVSISTDR